MGRPFSKNSCGRSSEFSFCFCPSSHVISVVATSGCFASFQSKPSADCQERGGLARAGEVAGVVLDDGPVALRRRSR